MGQALRKNVYQGSHDFLPFGRQRHLRLVPRMHQKSARIKVRHASSIGLEYTLDSGFNKLLARYTHSPLAPDDVLAADITADGVTAQLAQNAGTAVFIKDAQGTVTDVTDSLGAKIQHYVYSAFGELIGVRDAYGADVTGAPPVNTSYGFTGREKDSESNMLYYRARFYMPEIGKFIQADQDPGRLNLPATVINAYAYVFNNPLNLADPSGMGWLSNAWNNWLKPVVIGIAIIAVTVLTAGIAGGIIAGFFESGVAGAIVGATLGSVVGGAVSGLLFQATGLGSFRAGFLAGMLVGGIAGGIVGGTGVLGAVSAGLFGAGEGSLTASIITGSVFVGIDVWSLIDMYKYPKNLVPDDKNK